MKPYKLLKVINVILLLVFFALITTVVLHEVIPWGIFIVIHPLLGLLLVLLVIIHLILNFSSIKSTYFKSKGN